MAGLACGTLTSFTGPGAAAFGSACAGATMRAFQTASSGGSLLDMIRNALDPKELAKDAALGLAGYSAAKVIGRGVGMLREGRKVPSILDDLCPNGRTCGPANEAEAAAALDDGATTADDLVGAACNNSFSADTMVLMANGDRRPIAEVHEGDMVLATDPETGETSGRAVLATLPHTDQLLTLRTSTGEVVTTEDHRFWNATDHAWQESQHLDEGDQLLTANGSQVLVEELDWSNLATTSAYDLAVDDLHTFYVGVGDESLLVHNCSISISADDMDHVLQRNHSGSSAGDF